MAMQRARWGVQFYTRKERGYYKLVAEVRTIQREDLAERLAEEAMYSEDLAWIAKRIQVVKKETGKTAVLSDYGPAFEIEWQANVSDAEPRWYGGSINRACIHQRIGRAIQSLSKVNHSNPDEAIEALKATGLRYISDANAFVTAEVEIPYPWNDKDKVEG